MRHTNPNVVPSVLAGIAAGEVSADPDELATQLAAAAEPGPKTARLLWAKRIAYAQGFIAGYRL